MPSSWTQRGALALAASLALHALLVCALQQFPGAAATGSAEAPPAVTMLMYGEESAEEAQEPHVQAPPTPVETVKPTGTVGVSPHIVLDPIPLNTGQVGFSPMPIGPGAVGAGKIGSDAEGTTSFFGLKAQGQRVVFVIDRSASMGLHGALATATRELLASVEQLPADALFQVIVYHRQAEPILPGSPVWLSASADVKRRVGEAMETLRAEGSTDHLPALRRALGQHPDVIFFLTDADDLTPEQQREISRLNRGQAIIHTIELTLANQRRPDMPMQVLARENRGRYQAVNLIP